MYVVPKNKTLGTKNVCIVTRQGIKIDLNNTKVTKLKCANEYTNSHKHKEVYTYDFQVFQEIVQEEDNLTDKNKMFN